MKDLSIAKSPSNEPVEFKGIPEKLVVPFRLIGAPAKGMEEAIQYVNDFFNSQWYLNELAKIGEKPFYLSKNVMPREFPGIMQTALKFIPVVRVNVAKHRSGKVLAWVGSDSLAMNLNKTNIKRPIASLAGSVGHEFIHILDRFTPREFGHGSNTWTKAKLASCPYWHGTKIKEYVTLREAGKLIAPN